jgi:hypothetical protein
MWAYDFRNGADRAPLLTLEVARDRYRRRPFPGGGWSFRRRTYSGLVSAAWHKFVEIMLAVFRLAIPVTLLLVLLAATYLYSDVLLPVDHIPRLARNSGLQVSDLVLPLAWFCIHLTNRCYGAGYAFAQLLVAMVIGAGLLLLNRDYIDQWLSSMPSLTIRAVIAFLGAFLVANAAGIVIFDGARGPKWWTAPLAASVAVALAFSMLYYPAAFIGTDTAWARSALVHFAVFFAEAVLLLLPYYLLRSAMPPLSGFNGY